MDLPFIVTKDPKYRLNMVFKAYYLLSGSSNNPKENKSERVTWENIRKQNKLKTLGKEKLRLKLTTNIRRRNNRS